MSTTLKLQCQSKYLKNQVVSTFFLVNAARKSPDHWRASGGGSGSCAKTVSVCSPTADHHFTRPCTNENNCLICKTMPINPAEFCIEFILLAALRVFTEASAQSGYYGRYDLYGQNPIEDKLPTEIFHWRQCGQKVLNHNAYSCMLIEDGMLVNKRLPVNTADRWNKATVTYANISELNSSIFKSLLEDPFIVITT